MKWIGAIWSIVAFAIMAWIGLAAPSTSIAADDDLSGLYVTWPPIEPDKAIAAWLIKKHVAPDARFIFVKRGSPISQGIPFDVPGADFVRDHRRCTSEAVIQSYQIKNSKASQLASLARRIEIAYWAASFTEAETELIEKIGEISVTTTNYEAGLIQAIKLVNEWPK